MPNRVVVQQYGLIWYLYPAAYRKLLKAIAEGHEYDLDQLGVYVGLPVKPGELSAEQAQEELEFRMKELK